jgi:hypothetical protein
VRAFAAFAVVLVCAAVASAGVDQATPASDRVERWTVKTLQGRPVLIPAQPTTIAFLTSRPAPASLPDTRLPFERHIFTVTARVVLIRHEADDDFHVVLSDGRQTMITESPAPTCDSRAFPVRQAQMAAARRALRLCSRARITGVAFFDFDHGQTGVAPNAIDLHPILGFQGLAGAGAAAGGGSSATAGAGKSSGSARVRLVQVISPVSAGSEASVTVAVSPAQRARSRSPTRAARRRRRASSRSGAPASPGRGRSARGRLRDAGRLSLRGRVAGRSRRRSSSCDLIRLAWPVGQASRLAGPAGIHALASSS